MKSVRQGLREDDLEKDTYERLSCAACDEELTTVNDPEKIGSVRECPECGKRWRQLK